MFQGAVGSRVFFMGEERDKTFFEPLQIVTDPFIVGDNLLELSKESSKNFLRSLDTEPHATHNSLCPQSARQ